ncbi:MAG TPA: DUF4349 domain-containing protein [Phnomibacter sp.]|nr:DUF4349 domain-containing protein [Phnomibacter sp.]
MKAWHMIFLAAGMLAACHSSEPSITANADEDYAVSLNVAKSKIEVQSILIADSAAAAVATDSAGAVFHSGNTAPAFLANRQLIRTAHIQMECNDFAAFGARVHQMVKANDGWIDAEQETQSDYNRQNVLQVKVPVARFDALMAGLVGLDGKLMEKKVESEDVTNAIVDTRGRIEAKKIIRARYLELLKQANKMEDILQVQAEINSITEDMESAAYNVQHMQAQAAYSTIYFTYAQPLENAGSTQAPGFFGRLWDAIKTGGAGIQNLVIIGAAVWPLWLGIAIVAIWWKRRRSLTRPALAKSGTA